MCAEPNERCSFLDECGNDNLTLLPVGNRFSSLRVNNFDVNVIVPIVDSVFFLTIDADTGTIDFRESIDIIKFDTKLLADIASHLFAPPLRANHALFQVNLVF